MADIDRQGHGDERPSGQLERMSAYPASGRIAHARSSLSHVGPASTALMDRVRRVPAQALFAAGGLFAMGAVLSLAAMLRSSETLDALERTARSPRSQVSASSRATATPAPVTPVTPQSAAPANPRAASSASSNAAEGDPEARAENPKEKETDEASAEAASAPEEELRAARAKGVLALEKLSKQYPRDAEVLRTLLTAYSRQRSQVAAMGVAGRLLEAAPRAAEESEVQQAIMMAANGPPDVSSDALKLLATKMGSRGVDLLYDLLTAPRIGKLTKERASELLRDAAVRERATPALVVALELRSALPCARKALLARAREHGDARALAFLKPLTATSGCGILRRSDCYECMEPRKELLEVVATIQKRLETGTPK
jgi:hypothetical protein